MSRPIALTAATPIPLSTQVSHLFDKKDGVSSISPSEQLNQFLQWGNKSFEASVTRGPMHYKSQALRQVIANIKLNQAIPCYENLNKLQLSIEKWQASNPVEFNKRGGMVSSLQDEIDLRRQDRFLLESGAANTHRELLGCIHKVHGPQVYAAICRASPALNDHAPLHHSTLEKVREVLDSPYFQNFKFASRMVSASPASPHLDDFALSLVTSELAKFPHTFLQRAYAEGLQIAVTHGDLRSHLNTLPTEQYMPSDREIPPGLHVPDHNLVIISLEKYSRDGDWQIGSNHGSHNLVLHETGHAMDELLARSENFPLSLSKYRGFREAWLKDCHSMCSYFTQSREKGDFGDGAAESFAEGMAMAFDQKKSTSQWPHIDEYMQNLAARLEHKRLGEL